MDIDAVTLFVADPKESKSLYARLFGREPIFEDADSVAFRLERVIVNLLRDRNAPELIEPALVGSGDEGARFQLTIGVEDVDAEVARLTALGIAFLNGPLDRPWGVRTAALADPDGHVWELAQDIAS